MPPPLNHNGENFLSDGKTEEGGLGNF